MTRAKRRLEFDDSRSQDVANAAVAAVTAIDPLCDNDGSITTGAASASLVAATPERKKQRRGGGGTRGSSEGIIDTYFSPSKTRTTGSKKASVLVTPEKKEEEEQERTDASQSRRHVPVYIHKNLNYRRRGQAFLSEKRRHIF